MVEKKTDLVNTSSQTMIKSKNHYIRTIDMSHLSVAHKELKTCDAAQQTENSSNHQIGILTSPKLKIQNHISISSLSRKNEISI